MTTPSFRDWAVMLAFLWEHDWWRSVEHKNKKRLRYRDKANVRTFAVHDYILTRIERKEKALRKELAMAYSEIEALAHTMTHIEVKP